MFKKTLLALFFTLGCAVPAMASQNGTAQSVSQTASSSPKPSFSPLFIGISDTMDLVKNNDSKTASTHLADLKSQFDALTINDTHHALKTDVATQFDNAIKTPSQANLSALSNALYALEKAQNPVDYSQKQDQFKKRIVPSLDKLGRAIDDFKNSKITINDVKQSYESFNQNWVAGERVVRNTSTAHYGNIETAMALLRINIESQTPDISAMQVQFDRLKRAIDSYNQGDTITQNIKANTATLYDGIALLEEGLLAFQNGQTVDGQAKLSDFIGMWIAIEGDVSTRNKALYSKIESQIPLIAALGENPDKQQALQTLIDELKQINPNARYSATDSMLILLREGLEALLIVIALITALDACKHAKAKKYVYGGVAAGLLASVIGAIALQKLLPTMASGASREMLEGYIGIVAVIMMIGVGAWLHSKSSIIKWNAFIKRHLGKTLTTGSAVGLFGLAFLSVLREGAETILFYAGILPNIAMADFLLGIGIALAILAVVAITLIKTSVKLPIPLLFKILTWTIYFLGFKILGVSISALQLTNILNRTVLNLPNIEWAGFYASVQGVLAQMIYIAVVACVLFWQNRQKTAPI